MQSLYSLVRSVIYFMFLFIAIPINLHASSLTEEEKALLVLLFGQSEVKEIEIQSVFTGTDPSSDVLLAARISGGLSFELNGELANNGDINSISGFSLSSSNIESVLEVELNSSGRPTRLRTLYGDIEIEYLSDSQLVVTTTNINGETESFDVTLPTPLVERQRQRFEEVLSTDETRSAGVCNLRDSFGIESKVGKMVFQCTDDTVNLLSDNYISGVGVQTWAPVTALPAITDVQLPDLQFEYFIPLANDSNTDTAANNIAFEYSLNVMSEVPELEEWQACCKMIANDPELLFFEKETADNLIFISDAISAVLDAACLVAPLAGPAAPIAVTGSCVAKYGAQFVKSVAVNIVKEVVVKGVVNGIACSAKTYGQWSSLFQGQFEDVQFQIAKKPPGKPQLTYIPDNLFDLNAPTLPTFSIGREPSQLREIVAYDSSGSELSTVLCDGRNCTLNSSLAIGDSVTFRVFDNFYDRTRFESEKRQSQNYACADYKWKISNSSAVLLDEFQSDNETGISFTFEESGSYNIEVSSDNSSIDTAVRTINPDAERLLEPELPSINLLVSVDSDIQCNDVSEFDNGFGIAFSLFCQSGFGTNMLTNWSENLWSFDDQRYLNIIRQNSYVGDSGIVDPALDEKWTVRYKLLGETGANVDETGTSYSYSKGNSFFTKTGEIENSSFVKLYNTLSDYQENLDVARTRQVDGEQVYRYVLSHSCSYDDGPNGDHQSGRYRLDEFVDGERVRSESVSWSAGEPAESIYGCPTLPESITDPYVNFQNSAFYRCLDSDIEPWQCMLKPTF